MKRGGFCVADPKREYTSRHASQRNTSRRLNSTRHLDGAHLAFGLSPKVVKEQLLDSLAPLTLGGKNSDGNCYTAAGRHSEKQSTHGQGDELQVLKCP